MPEVSWSDEALAELVQIASYIRQFNPHAAEQISRDLRQAGDSLRDFPYRGRAAVSGLRQLVTIRPYIITYQVDGDRVKIVSIRHGARLPRDDR